MMNNAQLATASLDDIVFDGRNRGYGAYELRALYQRHVTRALAIAITICALLLVFPLVAQLLKDRMPVIVPKTHIENVLIIAPPLDSKIITPPPLPAVKPAVTTPAPPVTTIRFTPPVVAPDNRVTEEVPDQKLLATAHVSTITKEGSTEPDLRELDVVEGPKAVEGAVNTNEVYVSVEQMPELPGGGGQAAIVAAIQRAVKYPSLALRNGVEGRVFVSFTVNAKGQVTDAKILKGLGSGLDEETLRAIGTLPKFIPGKQNGREVSVSFSVPITFKIQ